MYNWAGIRDFLKILSLLVHPDYRGEKRSYHLLKNAIEIEKLNNLKRIEGETRESNNAIRSIFEYFGFKIIDTLDEYYQNPDERAIRYSLEIM